MVFVTSSVTVRDQQINSSAASGWLVILQGHSLITVKNEEGDVVS